jgi:phosphodiesterase/alkaline phosphatase D-like protein
MKYKNFLSTTLVIIMTGIITTRAQQPVGESWLKTDVPVEDAICFALYTVHNNTLKMTAQLYPLDAGVDRVVKLQIDRDGQWKTIAATTVSEQSYGWPQEDKKQWTAHFRLEDWDDTKNYLYRLVAAGGKATYEGTIRKDPVSKKEIVVAAFTGNGNYDRRLKPDIIRNIKAQDPDLLFFSGDQSYDHKHHQQAWLLFGQQFGEIIKDRPTVCIPDDHDIGQGNIWGESGIKAGSPAGDDGGYYYSPQYVNSVQNAQTSHMPDPYDPTPVKRGIGVYYTSLKIGKVGFAIIEDRKFKTGPKGLVPQMGPRADHITDPNYDPKKVDLPEGTILGDRQLKFLDEWGQNWQGVSMKAVLSQTIFANAAHRHGKYDYTLVADMDSNGWPQSARDRAIIAIRKFFGLHIAGDQHLASVIHHGVNRFRDAGYSFCVPSIVNYYNRWWTPKKAPDGKPVQGPLDGLGDYYDGFHNKITMHAYANPSEERKNKWGGEWGERAAGYGLVRFNTDTRDIRFECWPRGVHLSNENAEQYKGWPVTINQLENYSREAIAYLPKIQVSGIEAPVVKVIYEPTNQIVYTLRINGTQFSPKVFKDGLYTVKIGEQPGNMKTFPGLEADESKDRNDKILKVQF